MENNNVTIEDLVDLISEVVDLSGIQASADMILGEDIPVDSRDMLRILSRIEARYHLRFKPEEILTFKTLGNMLETLRHRIKQTQTN